MSAQNVKILTEGLEAFSAGDMERILQFAHPEFEAAVPPELSAEPDSYRGHEGVRRYFETFYDAMDEIRFEPQRFWDAGELVVVSMRMTARGKQTSIPVEQRFAQVWTIRDGRARRAQTYASLADALRAAGLPATAADSPSA
jgi:ketosteroid isomerase-like protein